MQSVFVGAFFARRTQEGMKVGRASETMKAFQIRTEICIEAMIPNVHNMFGPMQRATLRPTWMHCHDAFLGIA